MRTRADRENIASVFGTVEYVELAEAAGENGFITLEMKEADYEKKALQLGNILQMIRFH